MSNSTELYKKLMEQAQKDKVNLNANSLKELRKLYQDSIEGILNKADKANGGFTKAWLKDYEKYLRIRMNELDDKIAKLTKDAIISSSQIAATVNGDFLSMLNNKYELDIPKKLIGFAYNVSDDVLLNIINGGFYKDNKSLSERIWGYGDKNIKDIQYIINKGMMEQKSYLDIMKDLEMYVDPSAKKTWQWKKVYPGVNRQVDYNAQRLLRTSINHSFFNTNMSKLGSNPFVETVHWELSDQHYYRQVKHFGPDECDDYNGANNYGLGSGNFPKNEVPMPHVQCMCYQYAIIPQSLDDIGRELRDWINGNDNSKLDNWINPMSKHDDNINV